MQRRIPCVNCIVFFPRYRTPRNFNRAIFATYIYTSSTANFSAIYRDIDRFGVGFIQSGTSGLNTIRIIIVIIYGRQFALNSTAVDGNICISKSSNTAITAKLTAVDGYRSVISFRITGANREIAIICCSCTCFIIRVFHRTAVDFQIACNVDCGLVYIFYFSIDRGKLARARA